MTIYLTGASGYLGKTLADYFASQGHQVIALCRKDIFNHKHICFSSYSLGDTLDQTLPKPDVCIHCAYDLRPVKWADIEKINVQGSLSLFEQLQQTGCQNILYLSSISAFEGTPTRYGRAKLQIETMASAVGGISIRPGLIYGGSNEGLIGKLEAIAQKLPVIPLIGHGHYPQYLTDIHLLCQTIDDLLHHRLPITQQPTILAAETPVSFKELLLKLAGEKKPLLIPIPWRLPWLALKTLEMLNIPLAFKSDSVTSLVSPPSNPDFGYVRANGLGFEPTIRP